MTEEPGAAIPTVDSSSPESWRLSHAFDRIELGGEASATADPGYARAYHVRTALTLELVSEHAAAGARLLDVAAAQGNLSIALSRAGFDVTWNDLREELQGYVKRKAGSEALHFAPGDVFEIEAEAYDVVVATEIIEHVAHPDEFLTRLAALVRPGGHVVLTTPNGRFFRNDLPRFSDYSDPSVFESRQFKPDADGHIFLLHPDELAALGPAAGLALVDLRLTTSFFLRGWAWTGPAGRRLSSSSFARVERGLAALPRPIRERITVQAAAVYRRPA